MAPASFQQTIDRVAKHLDGEPKAQQMAGATLAMMLQSTQEPAELAPLVDRLLQLIAGSEDTLVQKNALAALAAAVDGNDSAAAAALEHGMAGKLAAQLQADPADPALQLNLLAAVGVLAEAGPPQLEAVVEAGCIEQLLQRCDVQLGGPLQEAAADGLCKVAAGGSPVAQAALVDRGALPALAKLLGSRSSEVLVRALLCLGMLATGEPARQRQLAETPGTLQQLLALMRTQEDADVHHAAASIFAQLARNEELKDALAGALREQAQQADSGAAGRFL